MGDIKWVKLSTEVFDNRKVRYLRRQENGNDLALMWIMLLTIAGRCNAGGRLFLTERIPYTAALLADELSLPEGTVGRGLEIMQALDMLCEPEAGVLAIAGWGEHQSGDRLEQIREQNRLRKAAQRERQRQAASPLPACGVTGASRDVMPQKEKEKKEEKPEGEFSPGGSGAKKKARFLPPTLEEVTAYCRERGSSIQPAAFVDYYAANGWRMGRSAMQDWQAAVRAWEQNAPRTVPSRGPRTVGEQQYTQREYAHDESALDAMMAAWQGQQGT